MYVCFNHKLVSNYDFVLQEIYYNIDRCKLLPYKLSDITYKIGIL